MKDASHIAPPRLSRREFVTGAVAGGSLLALGADGPHAAATVRQPAPQILTGREFDLRIGLQPVNFTGRDHLATAVNGTVPGPVLRWRQGDRVKLRVRNDLAADSSIHWHGIILPPGMDGVPGVSFDGIQPGETFQYEFDVNQTGTYWYHSHSGFQEQTGLYGALVIDPIEPEPFAYDRDYVVMLSDWTDEDPERVYAKLKKLSHYYNFRSRTAGDLWRDVQQQGVGETWRIRDMWNRMRMNDRDISDVTGYTYTFLMNGQTPDYGWSGSFSKGERIRLRVINGAAMSFFDVRIPGLKMTVVAADGQYVQPVTVDEFRIGVAETYDVIVTPESDQAYTIFAQSMDRMGYARGTLTPHPELTAPVPALDPTPILSHADMGMGSGDEHDHAAMDHAQMDHGAAGEIAKAGAGSNRPVVHSATERGPQVDMLAASPAFRLDDPGVGLRDNGRRVLTYADLRSLGPTPDPRDPGREIQLHLTGNMSRYMWSIDGVKFADSEPLPFDLGERLRITFVNDTMMHHPMHMHGMWSDLETGDGAHIPRKHTVVVQPGAKISYLVTADALGEWAYHCHLLYHMPGMFRKVKVS